LTSCACNSTYCIGAEVNNYIDPLGGATCVARTSNPSYPLYATGICVNFEDYSPNKTYGNTTTSKGESSATCRGGADYMTGCSCSSYSGCIGTFFNWGACYADALNSDHEVNATAICMTRPPPPHPHPHPHNQTNVTIHGWWEEVQTGNGHWTYPLSSSIKDQYGYSLNQTKGLFHNLSRTDVVTTFGNLSGRSNETWSQGMVQIVGRELRREEQVKIDVECANDTSR